jgi:hypothetical protein
MGSIGNKKIGHLVRCIHNYAHVCIYIYIYVAIRRDVAYMNSVLSGYTAAAVTNDLIMIAHYAFLWTCFHAR